MVVEETLERCTLKIEEGLQAKAHRWPLAATQGKDMDSSLGPDRKHQLY